MIRKKAKEHNFAINRKEFLTPLQKKIILFLAVNNPQTINETVKATRGNYRSSWDAFKELEKKNLIKPVNQKVYRGREYPLYWATETGILFALSERLKPDVLLRKTQEIYPESKALQFLIEIIPILGESAYELTYLSVVTNGKVDQSDLIRMFSLQEKLSAKLIEKYNTILKNYPEIYQHQVEYIKRARKNLEDLLDMYDAQ